MAAAIARFVDHQLARNAIKFGNDVSSGFSSDQNAPHRADYESFCGSSDGSET